MSLRYGRLDSFWLKSVISFSICVKGREKVRPQTICLTLVLLLLGREVAVLVNEPRQAGTYEAQFDGTGLASGVYLYRLTAGRFVETRKMILIR
jgi:hypothetical protein